jgi:hypothetical protein
MLPFVSCRNPISSDINTFSQISPKTLARFESGFLHPQIFILVAGCKGKGLKVLRELEEIER